MSIRLKDTANITAKSASSATSATKATQDSAGQQINTTYIKGLSVNGRTITYTKGDGSTGTITTQDTNTDTNTTYTLSKNGSTITLTGSDGKTTSVSDSNTTYSTGTTSTAGLTKLYTGVGTATDGTMTQAAMKTALDGKAASSHTHNYAGSSSAGGAANSANLLNITGGRATSANSAVIVGPNTSMMLSTSSMTTGKPASDGYITEYRWDNNGGWSSQLFVPNNPKGVLQYRSMNAGTWDNWNTVYSTCNPQTTITGNAGTATTLQTARTINGTSFNGSANITTANWGTARNIQIGNTSKSVNGSANVSWSLSEIGAAAASHTHNSITNQDTRGVNTTPTQMPLGLSVHLKSNDADGLYDGGNYHSTLMIKGWNDASGGPFAQMTVTANNNLYFRSSINDTWNAWKKVSLDGHTHNYAGSSSAGGAANTAVKLHTARTINGTNFDGTGNITTANWGTARTLTIGNTGKSVNGSGNVSWSLSEIGALPLAGGTLSGRLTANGRISAPTAGSSWINGMTITNATIGISTQQSENAYHPVLAVKTSGNHVANIGGIGNDFGFYGFKSGRTENGTDWSFKINAGTGAVSSTGNITAPTFVGALSGNASTATKATQDSAGQQINKTYIKGLSVNGKTITYTKGDGTTGTITTQDTNTTYSVGTASALGLTKLYTGTGTATDGTMTQNAIKTALDGKAASSHTHSYLPLSGGTVTGQTIFNNYLTLNAWSGYGTGTTQMWYDGNAKMLNIQNATGLKVGSNTVYHSGNFNPNDKADKSTLCTSWNWDDFNWRINNHHGLCSMTINQGGNASGLYEWGAGLTFGGTNSSAQFYSPHVGEEMYWRSKWRDDSVRGWHRIWHSGNMAAPHWGTGTPNNSDGRPDGTVYYRYA